MQRLIKSEFLRIWFNKKTKILLMVLILYTIANCILKLKLSLGSYNEVDYNVTLNSLNFSAFLFYEVRILLSYIVLPIIIFDLIVAEEITGAFRMSMIRPYKKYKFIISKWITLALIAFILIFMVFVISSVFGYLFMPKVKSINFYNINKNFNMIGALLYTMKFYLVQYSIVLFILSVATVIGVLISNSVISILGLIGTCIGLGFFTEKFDFLLNSTKYGFYTLGYLTPISKFFIIVAGIIGGLIISVVIWNKKYYIY